MNRWIGVLLLLGTLGFPALALAQGHPCDTTPPTSGTAISGQALVVHACHPGIDANGNPVTSWKLNLNGTKTTITMTKSATASTVNGKFEYTGSVTAPGAGGLYTYTLTVLSGTLESGDSNPFALTVSLPRVAPSAPSQFSLQ